MHVCLCSALAPSSDSSPVLSAGLAALEARLASLERAVGTPDGGSSAYDSHPLLRRLLAFPSRFLHACNASLCITVCFYKSVRSRVRARVCVCHRAVSSLLPCLQHLEQRLAVLDSTAFAEMARRAKRLLAFEDASGELACPGCVRVCGCSVYVRLRC